MFVLRGRWISLILCIVFETISRRLVKDRLDLEFSRHKRIDELENTNFKNRDNNTMFNNNGYVSKILRSPVFAATIQCRAVTLPKTIILPSPQKTVITDFEASSPSFGSRLSHAWPYANSKRQWSARKRHARREWSRELVEYERCPCAGKTRTFHELSVFETVFGAPAKRSKRHCTCRAYGSVRWGNVVKPRFFVSKSFDV